MRRAWLVLGALAACGGDGNAPVDAADALGLEAGLGTIVANPTTFDFGSSAPGDGLFPLTITNPWVVPTAPITVSVSGPDAGSFLVANDTCVGVPLAAGASCRLDVAIRCGATNRIHQATLTVAAMPGGSVIVPLQGQVAPKSCAAVFTVSPVPLAFGDQTVATSSPSKRVTFTNFGGKPSAAVTPVIESTEPGFAIVATTCTGPVSAGSICTVDVAFTPGSTGMKQANLRLMPTTTVGTLTGTGVVTSAAPP